MSARDHGEHTKGIDPEAVDAVESVWFAWDRFAQATTPISQASALLDLDNAMADVASWLPGYDPETGEVEES